MSTYHDTADHDRTDPYRVPLQPDLGAVIAAFDRQREMLHAAAARRPAALPTRTRRRFLRRLR